MRFSLVVTVGLLLACGVASAGPDDLLAPTFAQPVLLDSMDPSGVASLLLTAAESKHWSLLISLALVLGVWAAGKTAARMTGRLAPLGAFLGTPNGARVLVWAGTASMAIATGLLAPGSHVTVALLFTAAKAGLMGIGLHQTGKPIVSWWAGRAPAVPPVVPPSPGA